MQYSEPMRVGLIGLGAIGGGLLRYLRPEDNLEIVGALLRDPRKPRPVPGMPLVATAEDLLTKQPQIVVEMGGHAALACHGPTVLRAGVDLLIVSVGALAEPAVEQAILAAARAGGAQARILSGAI